MGNKLLVKLFGFFFFQRKYSSGRDSMFHIEIIISVFWNHSFVRLCRDVLCYSQTRSIIIFIT